jgi:hypothetical protein
MLVVLQLVGAILVSIIRVALLLDCALIIPDQGA